MTSTNRAVGSSIFIGLMVALVVVMGIVLMGFMGHNRTAISPLEAAPGAQTPAAGIPITGLFVNAITGRPPFTQALDVAGCADQTAGGVCDDILGVNLDSTLQEVNSDIVNARQGIQGAANAAAAANTRASNANNAAVDAHDAANAAQTTANGRQTAAQVQTSIDLSLAGFQEPGGNIVNGSIGEIKFDANVTAKLNSSATVYRPGRVPFEFNGEDRQGAVDARAEYFEGEVVASQSYVNIFSAGAASRIRVTLDTSVPEQVGTAGNAWDLVLGVDSPNTNVGIAPDTAARTFTLRLPGVGISLDELGGDLDRNHRLSAEVVGDGSQNVDYTATWGPNPQVGATTDFGNGGNTSATPRTAWRASYENDLTTTTVLAYGNLEEYQNWANADWSTVVVLVDPPLPIYSAGSAVNLFTGGNRTQAVAARDFYYLRNTGATQASRLLPLGSSTSSGVLITLDSDSGVGALGNSWSVLANGDAFSNPNSALAVDASAMVVGVNFNSSTLTAQELAHLFDVQPGFSSQLVGGISQTAVGFVAARLAGPFAGGVTAASIPRTIWLQDYDRDGDQFVTLSYGQTLERQVRRNSQWVTVDTLVTVKPLPAGFTVLVHQNAAPTLNGQWWLNITSTEDEFIERIGGTIDVPQVGSARPAIPTGGSEIYFRLTDQSGNTAEPSLAALTLPDGTSIESMVTFTLGTATITIRVGSNRHVYASKTGGGTTDVSLDIWTNG